MSEFASFYLANEFWVWLGIAALLLAIEIGTSTGWLLWPAGAAAATAVFTFAPLPWPVDVLVFVGLTVVSTLMGRRLLPRTAPDGPDINDPLARLIGHRGEAVADFVDGEGRILVDGKEWAAEAEDHAAVPNGAKVRVLRVVGGSRLMVKPA